MRLTETIAGTTFTFRDCKDVLNKASEEKSGDRTAEVAAQSVRERIAAKRLLAEFTLRELYEHPSVPYELDEITRLVIDDLDARGLIHDSTYRAALAARLAEGPISVYVGFDPTADSLHAGNLLGQVMLRRFQLAGHRPVVLAGGEIGRAHV